MLYAKVWGTGDPLVLVHGFTQSADGWGPIAEALSENFQLVGIDAPGHGRSAGVEADLSSGAEMMAAAATAALGPPRAPTWMGYSMGARYCLHVALQHPDLVAKLVLISATGGIDDSVERTARRQHDEKLARRVEEVGVEAFVREWLDQPIFATLAPTAAGIESRLQGSAAGLASSLRRAGTGTQEPLWEQLRALDMPVLVVAGELDAKFVALGNRLVQAIGPNAELALVEGAGHACHLEKPDRFLDLARPFLAT